jgi:hypothetical protein
MLCSYPNRSICNTTFYGSLEMERGNDMYVLYSTCMRIYDYTRGSLIVIGANILFSAGPFPPEADSCAGQRVPILPHTEDSSAQVKGQRVPVLPYTEDSSSQVKGQRVPVLPYTEDSSAQVKGQRVPVLPYTEDSSAQVKGQRVPVLPHT